MAEQNGPGAEFLDVERHCLVNRLDLLLTNGAGSFIVEPDIWAAVWLCDVSKLQKLVEFFEHSPNLGILLLSFGAVI